MSLARARRAALGCGGATAFEFRDQGPHGRLVGAEFSGFAVDL
jgi:hypothetical protein